MTDNYDPLNTLDKWQFEIGEWGIRKGWDIATRSEGDWAALIHTEVSEAFEAHRKGEALIHFVKDKEGKNKPEGSGIEYADAIIRILHWAEVHGVNMGELVSIKMKYNEGRPYQHGDVNAV